jgi:cation-transporting ATPase 13A3/4/5
VPGDILILKKGQPVPCDSILISGEVLINESNITGESVPVPKFALPSEDTQFDFQQTAGSTLLEGTHILNSGQE